MIKVYERGIILEKGSVSYEQEKLAQVFLCHMGNFLLGINPSWSDEKTSLMMRICHMSEGEVMKMVKDHPLTNYKGLINKIREELEASNFNKAKLKVRFEYSLE